MSFKVNPLENDMSGQTSDLDRRLREHNDPCLGKSPYTRKQKGPWKLLYSEEHITRGEALKRERFLKSGL